jgi:hypothetical protein
MLVAAVEASTEPVPRPARKVEKGEKSAGRLTIPNFSGVKREIS